MNINPEIVSRVKSIAYGGDGVIKEGNLTGFVKGVIPGELIKARVTEIKKNYFRAELIEVIEKSPYRVTPPCPYFNICAGCAYQHIAYEKHPEIKTKQLQELLEHIGKTNLVSPIKFISSPKPYEYRNQLDVGTKIIRKKLEMGFIGFDNKTLVPIDKCLIAKKALNNGIKKVKEELNNPISIKNIKGDIILKCGHDETIDFAFSEAVQPKGNYKLLSETIDGQAYYFSLSTFFQTNPYILPPLLSELKNILNPEPDEILFDLYCGTGLFSIYFSPSVKNAYGIELNPGSVKLAKKTVEKNNMELHSDMYATSRRNVGIKNCGFFEGDAGDLFTKIFAKYKTDKNIIILDPPRAGLNSEILKYLQEIRTNKLVYISCEPSKLARDLNILCANGYEIKNIIIADMFPQTKHMESIAILSNS